MPSEACWEVETKQFSVIPGNLPGSGGPGVAKARNAEQSVATVGNDCSLLGFLCLKVSKRPVPATLQAPALTVS